MMVIEFLRSLRAIFFQFKGQYFPSVPSIPHMDAESIAFLTAALENCHTYLEYGSGGSTLLAVESNVPRVISVESDEKWIRKVKRKVRSLKTSTRIDFYHASIGKVTGWGTPVSVVDGKVSYAELPWTLAKPTVSPMLILIDGRFRVVSFLVSLVSAPRETVIIFDDYFDRSDYWVVEKVIFPIQVVGRSAIFKLTGAINLLAAEEIILEYSFNSD